MRRILRFCVSICLGCTLASAQAQAAEKVRVVMFRAPETMWQTELDRLSADPQALWGRLDEESRRKKVQLTLDVECPLPDDQTAFEWKHGLDQKFITGWRPDLDKTEVVPAQSTQRFLGTTLSVASQGMTPGGRLGVALRLDHDTRPALMRKHNYANAAEGKERERLSVEYPQFEKVVWQGAAAVGHEWRLLAQVLQPADAEDGTAARRYLLFITRL